MEHFTPRQALIGEAIVDSINDDGYLEAELEEILSSLDESSGFTLDEVQEALTLVQRLDPAGVGARTFSECIILQLQQLDELLQSKAAEDTPTDEQDPAALQRIWLEFLAAIERVRVCTTRSCPARIR